ncbi:MAG TPA: CRTAC1 family protein, partial [Terracidiphilus sp.]|nr:CRTAC1 family protein [Terracidiphilus sp.]
VTEQAGLATDIYGMAVTAADYDNDGYVDLLVTGYGWVILYHNNGDGTFTDVTKKAGLDVPGWSISSTWLDYDRDGCVDLFVGRYVKFDPGYRNFYAADNYPGPLDYEGETNKLFHNNCNGTFTDVSEQSGISRYVGRTMGVAAADFDGDGWDDIYVANDRTANLLLHNNQNGTFTDIALEAGTAFGQNGESTSAMGPVFADLEGKGRLDLWVTDARYNRMLSNAGKMSFEDIGARNGVSQANAQYVSWGSGIYDFDNDGSLDILIFHGGLIHLIPQEHTLFRGLGKGRFQDDSEKAGNVLNERSVARGACFADYDNDGKMDAFVVNLGARGTLVHNISTNTEHWLEIKLVGTKSNRDGIGAQVKVFAGGKSFLEERVAESGYLSQNDGRLHFGLGAASRVDKIEVRWPSGQQQTLTDQAVDRVLTVQEPK